MDNELKNQLETVKNILVDIDTNKQPPRSVDYATVIKDISTNLKGPDTSFIVQIIISITVLFLSIGASYVNSKVQIAKLEQKIITIEKNLDYHRVWKKDFDCLIHRIDKDVEIVENDIKNIKNNIKKGHPNER